MSFSSSVLLSVFQLVIEGQHLSFGVCLMDVQFQFINRVRFPNDIHICIWQRPSELQQGARSCGETLSAFCCALSTE